MAAKLTSHAGHVIRIDKDTGTFHIDGVDGKYDTLIAAKKAIDTALVHAVDEPALFHDGQVLDGDPGPLEEVRFLGRDPGRGRLRIKRSDGLIQLYYRESDLFPDRPDIRDKWERYRHLRVKAHRTEEEAQELADRLPKIGDEIC